MICICSEFFMPRRAFDNGLARVRLGRASRRAESPRTDTDRVRQAKEVSCYPKGN